MSNKLVVVDFLELDDMRLFIQNHANIKQWRTKFKWKDRERLPYENSGFYIGRSGVRFAFYYVRATSWALEELISEMRRKYKEYDIRMNFTFNGIVLRKR